MTSKGFCVQTHRKAQERPSLRGSKGPGPADILTWHFWPREYISHFKSLSLWYFLFFLLYFFVVFQYYLCVRAHVCEHHGVCVEVRGQLDDVSTCLHPVGPGIELGL